MSWSHESKDFLGHSLLISIETEGEEQTIIDPGMTISRDPGCVYTKIHVAFNTYDLPDGEFNLSVKDFNAVNIFTLSDALGSTFYLTK